MKASHDDVEVQLERACVLGELLLEVASTKEVDAGSIARQRLAANLLETSEVAFAAFEGPDYKPRLANEAWRQLYGGAPTDPAKELPASILATMNVVMRTERPSGVTAVEIRDTRLIRFCAASAAPFHAPSGELAGVIVACADTTEDVIGRLLSVTIDDLIWTGPFDGTLEQANEAWYAYTGLHDGTSWLDAIHEDDRERCIHARAEAARVRNPISTRGRLRRADCAYLWHQIRFARSALDPRVFAAAIAVDNEREAGAPDSSAAEQAARGDAELTSQLKDRFFATVSHELRAPLTTMLLWEKVLRDESADADLRRTALDAIHQSAVTQSRLVGDLLDVTRASRGKLHVDLRPLDVARVVQTVVDELHLAMTAKSLQLELVLGAGAMLIEGDAVRLHQVLDNVLRNALKFTEPGGRVRVALQRAESDVTIEVTDTGRGISKEFLSGVFEPFSQLDDSLTRSEGGLGLGLTIARELVLLHHGEIDVSSPGIGKGTTFTVRLPALKARRPSTPPPRSRTAALVGLRLLVIDDDQRVRSALRVLLARAGATVEIAASAESARDVLERESFDAMICDVAMPGEDGYAFIRALRTSGCSTPALALTAYATAADAHTARDAGFDVHISKPVDLDHLVASVQAAVEARIPSATRE